MEEKNKEMSGGASEHVENAVNTKLSDLEGRLYVMVEESVRRHEFSEGDKKTIKDVVQEAFILGKTTGFINGEGKEVFDDFKNMLKRILDPGNEKYKSLYLHQNHVTSNLLSIASTLLVMNEILDSSSRPPLALTSMMGLGSHNIPS